MGGAVRFGPDTQWIDSSDDKLLSASSTDLPAWCSKSFRETDYQVDISRSSSFYAEIRKYWPSLPDGALEADYSGFRPKLIGPLGEAGVENPILGRDLRDFIIESSRDHGVDGLVNLYGIESPGLTCCISIAEYVEQILRENY